MIEPPIDRAFMPAHGEDAPDGGTVVLPVVTDADLAAYRAAVATQVGVAWVAAVNALGDAQLADIPRREMRRLERREQRLHDQLFGRRRSPQLAIRAAIRRRPHRRPVRRARARRRPREGATPDGEPPHPRGWTAPISIVYNTEHGREEGPCPVGPADRSAVRRHRGRRSPWPPPSRPASRPDACRGAGQDWRPIPGGDAGRIAAVAAIRPRPGAQS